MKNIKIIFASILSRASADLIYSCDLDTVDNQLLSQEDYEACGDPCPCEAFQAICIYDDLEEVDFKAERVTLEDANLCE